MLSPVSPAINHADFLSGGGFMGERIRAHDWAATPLGAPQVWPQALRTAVRLMLNAGHPIYIFWGAEGACLYNDAYSRFIGPERHPCSLGQPAQAVWEEIWPVIGPQIEQVMDGRGATWHENQLIPITRHGKLEDVYWTYSYSPIDDHTAPGGVGGVLVICTETTPHMLSLKNSTEKLQTREQANVTAALLASIVESSQDAIISKDLNGIIRSWNSGAEHMFGYTAAEAIGQPIVMLIPDDYLDQEPEILGRIVKGERIAHFETVRRRKDGTVFDISLTVSPVRDGSGTIIGASKVGRDISESRASQRRQKLLLLEMNHRIKNLFAVVSGVVAVSARAAGAPRELTHAIQSRLGALARAHDLTLQSEPEARGQHVVPMAELVKTLLSPYDNGGNIRIEGPALDCGGNSATAFALLLHEFATNAVKYGALLNNAGHVDIEWRAQGDNMVLCWRESGGPASAPKEQEGFGGTLVRATVSGLGGTITRDWKDAGLTITLTIPLQRLKA